MPSPASTAALVTSVRTFTGTTGRSRLRNEWQLRPQSCLLASKNAAQCVEWLLRGSCDATPGHLAKVRFGPDGNFG